ncbi:MAG: hypothetical protein WA633_03700 [Stellaceae bacterium]
MAQESADLLLNLWIVQQTQKHPFERLVLLRRRDLVIEFGSVIHQVIIPKVRQPSAHCILSPCVTGGAN